jgi:hypothetical protein
VADPSELDPSELDTPPLAEPDEAGTVAAVEAPELEAPLEELEAALPGTAWATTAAKAPVSTREPPATQRVMEPTRRRP